MDVRRTGESPIPVLTESEMRPSLQNLQHPTHTIGLARLPSLNHHPLIGPYAHDHPLRRSFNYLDGEPETDDSEGPKVTSCR
jgi:hypothetical protein